VLQRLSVIKKYGSFSHENKSVFILRTLTTWHCPQSNAAAAARQAAIYDRYLLPTTPTAANLQQRFAAVRLR